MDIPADRMPEGGTTHDVMSHELGHAIVADLVGLPTNGSEVISHLHPDSRFGGAAASTTFDFSKIPGVTTSPYRPGMYKFSDAALKDTWPKFLQVYLAGGVTQELAHGIPFETNEGTTGDIGHLRRIGGMMGFTPEETQGMIDGALDQTRALLNHPATLDIIKQNAGVREEGLSKTLHASADKVQDVIRQVREARKNEGNTETVGGANGAVVSKTEPGEAGSSAQGNVREDNGQAVPASLEANATPRFRKVVADTPWATEQKTGMRRLLVRVPGSSGRIGFLRYSGNEGDAEARIGSSYIDVDYRNQGIAKEMYKSAIEDARARGIKVFKSDTMVSNDAQHVWDSLMRDGQYPVQKIYTNNFNPYGQGGVEYHIDLTEKSAAVPSSVEASKVKSPNADISESQPTATYHPDLQKVVDRFGTSEDASGITNGGASFITPDGKFIHLNGATHDAVIDGVTGRKAGTGADNRVGFLNDTGAVRVRFYPLDKAGPTTHLSVPKGGVTPEQIPAIQRAIAIAGRNGNVVMERADLTSETKDRLTMSKDFPRPSDAEKYLRQIEAHPEQHGTAVPATMEANKNPSSWAEKAAAIAKAQGGGFTINPRTGEAPTTGYQVEIGTEQRPAPLDRDATPKDIQNFYDQNKQLFDQHPELHVGGYGKELNLSAHTDSLDGAKRLAKKLDQISVWDNAKGEEIPTGGTSKRTEFPNYPIEDRLKDLRGEPLSDIKGFEHLSKDFYDHMEPDERAYLQGDKTLQRNAMVQYHKITPSVPETTNAMQAGAALGGWWRRYIDVFHNLTDGGEAAANTMGPSHAEVLKQWHAAVSGNKSVEDANNLAWHTYADWLDAGKPTDRASVNAIVAKNGAQLENSGKKGNAAIADKLGRRGKVVSEGIDTSKLFNLVNSPEMRGEKPFTGDVFSDDPKNPLMGSTAGARKIPSMGATVAGAGNLNRLVIDTHIRDFYGQPPKGSAPNYIADSVHLRQAAEALGLKGGEGQEQLWGTVLGLKTLLKQGLTPEEAGSKLDADTIKKIGKDYAEVIANDPEITQPGGVLDRLKEKYGIGRGSAGAGEAHRQASGTSASQSGPTSSQTPVSPVLLAKTAERVRGQISDTKIKKPAAQKFTAVDMIRGLTGLKNPGNPKAPGSK
jgi:GNAT superfamily N-acetyltransferase